MLSGHSGSVKAISANPLEHSEWDSCRTVLSVPGSCVGLVPYCFVRFVCLFFYHHFLLPSQLVLCTWYNISHNKFYPQLPSGQQASRGHRYCRCLPLFPPVRAFVFMAHWDQHSHFSVFLRSSICFEFGQRVPRGCGGHGYHVDRSCSGVTAFASFGTLSRSCSTLK